MTDQSFSPSLGARTLQKEEINLSLPTYSKLLEQIDTIRKNIAAYPGLRTENRDSRNAFLRPQVINNISILGRRGSGKSSILKTLYHDLEANKEKNILLPPIVPENLESHMTLMSSLLGLLNDQVKQLSKKRQSSCPGCPPEKDPLEKEYRQLMECYVHLQKPYQDISIQQYSTEYDYVRTMSNVFEAGDQFSWKFWNFIDHLLKKFEEDAEDAGDALLFVFIDDIDLSTYRCSDVVRTLLGYISHPRVVTVLAGDIEVFGEALTLDFLRQEELLGKDSITESYTVSQISSENEKDLLGRKKELAYEYLKKVMPPMNRHSISIWTLSNRGKFCPVGLYNSIDRKIDDLQALLAEANQINQLLSGYFSNPQEQGQVAPDHVLYHLFDSTARGLINCYVAIEQLVRHRNSKKNQFENVKFALETIVFSNADLNALRDQIFSHFLQFGAANSSTYIFFSNFNDWIDQQLPYLADYGTEAKNIKQQGKVSLELETSIFRIFVYLDWAARLLDKGDVLESEDYETAKKKALFLLCVNGAISEKTEKLTADDRMRLYLSGISNFNSRTSSDYAAAIALRCFFSLPFPLAIRYFRSFDIPEMLEGLSEKKNTETVLDKLQRAVDFINVLKQFYSDNLSKASACLAEQPEMLEFIENWLKGDQKSMLVSVICNAYFKKGDSDDNKACKLSPLYGKYCKNGIKFMESSYIEGSPENVQRVHRYYLPYSIHRAIQNNWISKSDLDDYFRSCPALRLSELAFMAWKRYLLDSEGIHAVNGSPINSAESHCADSWNKLLEESKDFSGAMPFYNFYSEHFWKRISDGSHRLKPLKDTYEDPAWQANKLCGSNPKESPHDMEQRLKVLFAIDSGGLWPSGVQNKEDESPTRQIKAYILKQLISSEDSLVTAWKLQSENFILRSDEQADQRCPLITAKGATAAFEQLKSAYTGRSRTLAKWCIQFLKCLFEQKPTDRMTTAEYIYARCVLNRLIWSNAWYGKAEARTLLSVLDHATLDLRVDGAPPELDRYIFWFHCYCRYRVAEESDKTYTLIDQACNSMKLIQEAGKELDQRDRNIYYEDMREKGHLEDALIQQIPKLFE